MGLSLKQPENVSELIASSNSISSVDGSGPKQESFPLPSRTSDHKPTSQNNQTPNKIRSQQSDTEVILSGQLSGSFSSEVGRIRIGPSDSENITAEILPDGSFATTVPAEESLNIAYVQTDGGSELVTLNGNPDVFYITAVTEGLQNDLDLGTIEIPEGHLFDVRVVDDNGLGLENITIAIRSLAENSDDWWQIFYESNADGYFQSSNSPTGIEVSGEVEVAILSDTGDDRVPDVDTTAKFTVSSPRAETLTVDPITITGTLVFADGSAASDQDVTVFTDSDNYATVSSVSDGSFSVDLPPAPTEYPDGAYEIQYYRQELFPDPETAVPIDGYVDMYAGPNVDFNTDTDIGQVTIPEGWLTEVRVVDSDGSGIENARVSYAHKNEEFDSGASYVSSTNSTGYTPISGRTGLFLSGSVTISVNPPDSDEYADNIIEKELNINEPTSEEVTIPSPVDITNVNIKPKEVQTNSEHELQFTAQNVSADDGKDDFSISIPNSVDLVSVDSVSTDPNYDFTPNRDGNTIEFSINPDDPEIDSLTVDVTADITLSDGGGITN